ncbi:MAG: hypothetical protein ACR2LS_00340 [Thermomicrobiales bacterium]
MAISHTTHDQTVADGRAYLIEHNKIETNAQDISDDLIIESIRECGWEPIVTGTPGDWTVEAEDLSAPELGREVITYDPDRTTALLRTLAILRYWANRQQGRRMFDERVRRRLGISGEEFLRRLDAGELDRSDRDVEHLMVMESFGR